MAWLASQWLDDVMVSLSNGSTIKIEERQTCTEAEEKSDLCWSACGLGDYDHFRRCVCKITKGDMVMAHGKKDDTLNMTFNSGASISVASSELDIGVWHAYKREGNEGYALQG